MSKLESAAEAYTCRPACPPSVIPVCVSVFYFVPYFSAASTTNTTGIEFAARPLHLHMVKDVV